GSRARAWPFASRRDRSSSCLSQKNPVRLKQWECYQADTGWYSYKQGSADLPFEQGNQANHRDQCGEQISHRNPTQQHTRPKNRPNRGTIGSFDESLDVWVVSMPD